MSHSLPRLHTPVANSHSISPWIVSPIGQEAGLDMGDMDERGDRDPPG